MSALSGPSMRILHLGLLLTLCVAVTSQQNPSTSTTSSTAGANGSASSGGSPSSTIPPKFQSSYQQLTGQYITLRNNKGMTAVIIPLGGIIQRLIVPDKNGKPVDVALGMTNAADYLALDPNPYFGGILGRVSNRIVGAQFTLNGKTYTTSVNDKIPEPSTTSTTPTVNDTIHGGLVGYTFKVWSARKLVMMDGEAAALHLTSQDGDQGFPGRVDAWVIYKVDANMNRFTITWLATTDQPTPISMSSHAYFNLNGHNSNTLVTDHTVQLNVDHYTPDYNNTIVPTGQVASVAGTPFDLRKPTVIGSVIDKVPGADNPPGYDINYVTRLGYPKATSITDPAPKPELVATVSGPRTGIKMDIYTDAPGFEWYTGNHLPGPDGLPPIKGKDNAQYVHRGAFALEPQGWPMAVKYPKFPSVIVNPGEIYTQQLVWDFSTTTTGTSGTTSGSTSTGTSGTATNTPGMSGGTSGGGSSTAAMG